MGADFLLYSLPWAQLDEARQKLLHDTIDQLKDEPLQEVADGVGLFDDDDRSKVRTALHTAVREYLELDNRRDTTTWRNCSDPITRVYTGGLSWGEAPTDCCQTFDVIATCEPIYEMLQRWALEDVEQGRKQPVFVGGLLPCSLEDLAGTNVHKALKAAEVTDGPAQTENL